MIMYYGGFDIKKKNKTKHKSCSHWFSGEINEAPFKVELVAIKQ